MVGSATSSLEVEVKVTLSPTRGVCGLKLKAAVGARFTGTLTVTGPMAPSASVTRRVTDFAPEVANEVVGETPVASVNTPSPLKSQL